MSNPKQNLIFLHAQKYIMIFVGKWFINFENNISNKIYKTYSFFMESYFFIMTQHILVSMIIYRACQERVFELACYYIQYTNSNICSVLSKKSKIRRMFNYIIDYEAKRLDQPTAHIFVKYAELNRKVINFFILLTSIAGAVWYTLVIKDTFSAETAGNCLIQRGLIFQLWYPFDMYNKCFAITLLFDVLLYISAVSVHIYNKITPVSFMIFILGQIKTLQEMIKRIEKDAADIQESQGLQYDEAVLKTIRICLAKHNEVIGLMHLIDSACKEIVMIGFFTNSLELAAFFLKLLTDDDVFGALRTIGILCMTITQLFIFFWFANEIKVESTGISDVIYYEINWLHYDNRARKDLMLMMIRSQTPLTIRVAAIGDMSIDTFKKIMKLCYSISTFFKTVYM